MSYTPEQELAQIRRLIEQAEQTAERLRRLVPKESEWLTWRLNQHQRQLDDIHREMAHLVNEAQEAMLRADTAVWRWSGDMLADYDMRGIDEHAFPHVPSEFAGKTLWEVLQKPDQVHRWRQAWMDSKAHGTCKIVSESVSKIGVKMRYHARVHFKPGGERIVYVRPVAVASLAKTRQTTRI